MRANFLNRLCLESRACLSRHLVEERLAWETKDAGRKSRAGLFGRLDGSPMNLVEVEVQPEQETNFLNSLKLNE